MGAWGKSLGEGLQGELQAGLTLGQKFNCPF